jgi:hypothetical protein
MVEYFQVNDYFSVVTSFLQGEANEGYLHLVTFIIFLIIGDQDKGIGSQSDSNKSAFCAFFFLSLALLIT